MSALVVVRCGPGASIQDLGRAGRLAEGLPPSGALDPDRLRAANESLGNSADTAAIELVLHGATFRAEGALTISIDGEPRTLTDGESLAIESSSVAARYVALPGGIDAPIQLGSRSTLMVAHLGGLDGRALRPGDRVSAIASAASTRVVTPPVDDGSPIRVVLGPDVFARETIDRLLTSEFRVSTAFNRVGVRLDGPRLDALAERPFSTPMIRGAIQVTRDGTPIVLGPDHPTTGGYPVIATVVVADRGRLASRRPGASVRFRVA